MGVIVAVSFSREAGMGGVGEWLAPPMPALMFF
jgi:hypothetical protein